MARRDREAVRLAALGWPQPARGDAGAETGVG